MSVWVRALNGAVIEVPDHNAAEYVEQGHTVHATEDEALARLREVTAHYNERHGCSPGDLRVVRRERRD